MEQTQTLLVDTETLNKIVEMKVEELVQKREKAILEHAGIVIRQIVHQFVKDNHVAETVYEKEFSIKDTNSALSLAINRLASNKAEEHLKRYSSDNRLDLRYQEAIKQVFIQNKSVGNLVHTSLVDIIENDPLFKPLLKAHVEKAFQAKIEKHLNNQTEKLSSSLMDKFLKQLENGEVT